VQNVHETESTYSLIKKEYHSTSTPVGASTVLNNAKLVGL
jgi:hypothetical protein